MPASSIAKHTAAPTDAIALAAYLDWVAAGKPSGRDEEFWLKAESRLGNGETKTAKAGARKVSVPAKAA